MAFPLQSVWLLINIIRKGEWHRKLELLDAIQSLSLWMFESLRRRWSDSVTISSSFPMFPNDIEAFNELKQCVAADIDSLASTADASESNASEVFRRVMLELLRLLLAFYNQAVSGGK